jgi:aryl-alcohol dehydrogenase-like predicted oxidoreductase
MGFIGANKMQMTLGSTDIAVSPLGIGTWAWGDSLFWSYGKDYGATQVKQAFEATVAAGITFFDTAEIYGFGESERLLGQFMRQTDQPIQIATKYFPLPWRIKPEAVKNALSESLERLQTKQVALYQVHQPFDFFMGQETLMQALAAEVKRGRILAVGVSNYSAEQMRGAHRLLAAQGIPLAVNQVRYSLLSRRIETNGIMDAARVLGVTLLAYSPLAQGLLTGKYTLTKTELIRGARQFDSRFTHSGLQRIKPVLEVLHRIGANHDRTPAQVALNWLIAQGNVIPIPGAKNAEQACQNAAALGWEMSLAEQTQLDVITRGWR